MVAVATTGMSGCTRTVLLDFLAVESYWQSQAIACAQLATS